MGALPAPVLREIARSPLPGAIVAVTLPIWYQLGRNHDDVHSSAAFIVISGAALLALAFDDRAERTLNACAVPRNARRLTRAVVVAVLVGTGSCSALLVAHLRGAGLGAPGDRLPEAVAAAALASACAACAVRAGVRTPGLAAALTAVLGMVTVTGISGWSTRFDWLPQVANPDHASQWWLTASVAGGAACWWSRDPAARSFAATVRPSPS